MSPVFGRLDPRRGIVAVAIFAVLVAATTAGSLPTKGPIPPQAFRLDGPLDPSLLPDFVPAQGRDGQIAGYVPKAYLIGSPGIGNTTGGPTGDVAPVFAADLRTLVGHMVPDKGFVPLGVDPASVPNIPVQQGPPVATPPGPPTSLTLYVRTAAAKILWFGVVPASDTVGAVGTTIPVSVACLDVPVGGRAMMFDRPPQDAGAITLWSSTSAPGPTACPRSGSTSRLTERSDRARAFPVVVGPAAGLLSVTATGVAPAE